MHNFALEWSRCYDNIELMCKYFRYINFYN